MYFELYLKNTW